MSEHLIHELQHGATLIWVSLTLALIACLLLYVTRIFRQELVASNHPNRTALALTEREATLPMVSNPKTSGEHDQVQDTLFILPDISNYTRFIACERIDNERSQQVIFSLMNAMIEAAAKTLELSKIEGDAVLFYKDARDANGTEIGNTVMAVFDAFFDEQHRMMNECIGEPDMRSEIANLDLKIFVHRGRTNRFNFRGTIDHFGTDVTILHKLMKNSIGGHRYVMVTEAADGCIQLPAHFQRQRTEERLDHVGVVRTSVFTFESEGLPINTRAPDASKVDPVPSSSRRIV